MSDSEGGGCLSLIILLAVAAYGFVIAIAIAGHVYDWKSCKEAPGDAIYGHIIDRECDR